MQLAILPLDAACNQRRDLAILTLERLGLHGPVALAAFFMRRRGAQLHRPVRPHQRLVFLLGRLRQQFELRDGCSALAIRRADAVRARIAAADDNHVLAVRGERWDVRIARDAAILQR